MDILRNPDQDGIQSPGDVPRSENNGQTVLAAKPADSPAAAIPAQTPPQAAAPTGALYALNTWLLWRLCALGPWIWLLSAVLHKAFGEDLLSCPGIVALTPILTFIAAQGGQQQIPPNWPYSSSILLNLFGVAVYVMVIAPGIWIYFLFWRLPKALTRFASVFHLITHPVAILLLLMIIGIIWLGLLFVQAEAMLVALIYVQVTFVILLLVGGLRWASDLTCPHF